MSRHTASAPAALLLLLLACSDSDPPPEWPAGSYCVLLATDRCPSADNGEFERGVLVIDTDDEGGDTSQAVNAGASTAGNGEHARLQLCCGEFADTGVEFPDDPFAILAGGFIDSPECPGSFASGVVFIDAEDDEINEDADSHVEGVVGASATVGAANMEIHLCASDPASSGEWPEGHYCVFAGDPDCPAGFDEGRLVTDDEDSGNIDALEGEVGAITQADSTTTFPICCQ